MRALVFHGPFQLTVEERPEPRPGPADALLQIVATGICGSDLHGYTGKTGRRHPGQVMGHETVARVLKDKTGWHQPGTLVTVNPVLGCGYCPACAAGTPQRCPDRRVIGVQPELSAAFAERMIAPSQNVVALPEGTPAEIGALVEPLAVGYQATRRGALTSDDVLHILGAGPIGQAVAIAARRQGTQAIVIAEPDPGRRSLIGGLGFEVVDDIAHAPGPTPTLVIDAVGAQATLTRALEITAPGGRIVLVGMANPTIEIPAYAVSTAERTLLGSFTYDNAAFTETAAWAGAHAAELAPLIEARTTLEEAPEKFRTLAAGTLTAGKILVHPEL